MIKAIKKICNSFGIDIIRYPHGEENQIVYYLTKYSIDTIIDIGANKGQFGSLLRTLDYKNHIVSFEPLDDAFKILSQKSANDKKWDVYNIAIGDINEISKINIAANSHSSSLLETSDLLISNEKTAIQIKTQTIEVQTLDSIFNKIKPKNTKNVYLKSDTQGFEKAVINGAKNILSQIKCVQIEMPLYSLYEGEALFNELIETMQLSNFHLSALMNGYKNNTTDQLFEVDGIFVNKNFIITN